MPSVFQTKDYISLLVCCCIKWDSSMNGKHIPSWDSQKFHRLQTLLHIVKDNELIEQAKHDIDFINHWRIEMLLVEYCSSIKPEHHQQVFYNVLILLSNGSYTTEVQSKFDSSIIKIVSEEFGIDRIVGTHIFNMAKSFTSFTSMINRN